MDYTKGEWKFSMLNDLGVEGDSESVCHITRRVNLDESEANAQLIASAPDLHTEVVEADKVICQLCKRLNPQHAQTPFREGCNSCEERESRLKALAKVGK